MSVEAVVEPLERVARTHRTVRVLDVGCGDGWLGWWLARNAPRNVRVEVVGVEPDKRLAAKARERGYRRVLEERAPRALEQLPTGSFQLVVVFELLEHLDDRALTRLLTECERVCAPGGEVLVSTPDGAFAGGGNPNHRRALRSIDLVELLRRRGVVEVARVGGDGVTVASYRPRDHLDLPAEPLEVAIVAGPCVHPWTPRDITERGLGGSETAATMVASRLAARGHVVTLFGEAETEGVFGQVVFRDWRRWRRWRDDPWDLVVVSRSPELLDQPIKARRVVLWQHDLDFGPRLTPSRADRCQVILGVSRWHAHHLRATHRHAASKIRRTRNGIDPQRFSHSTPTWDREPRVVFSSSPDRGLDVLLQLWPRVVAETGGEAELVACWGPAYERAAKVDARLRQLMDHCRDMARRLRGVELAGTLNQTDLAGLMLGSQVWAHPSWCSTVGAPFLETSCIGAMEAQAAGLVPVASRWGALPETIGPSGILVDGPAPSELWRDRFARALLEALTSGERQRRAWRFGPPRAQRWRWEVPARHLELLATVEASDG